MLKSLIECREAVNKTKLENIAANPCPTEQVGKSLPINRVIPY